MKVTEQFTVRPKTVTQKKNFHFERIFNWLKSDFNNELALRGARKFGERDIKTHQMFFVYISHRNNSRSFGQIPYSLHPNDKET